MEAIQQAVVGKGFSLKVAQAVSSTVCEGSQKVYQSRWAYFSDWCETNNFQSTEASLQQVADFLMHLFEERKTSISTIKGYRTAISKVLFYTSGADVSHSDILSDLISSFEHKRPQRCTPFPKWDLKLVLDSLSKPPYEPLATADRKALTLKTCFLLFLASGSRCSEIHALDIKHIVQKEKWKVVTLSPHPKFLPKNFNYTTGGRNFEGFQIEALKHRLGPGLEQEASLCPVRALRFYLDRTKPLRGDNTQLFISMVGEKKTPVCKNTIASWVKNTVLEAYRTAPGKDMENLKVSSHEVRALATSTAFYSNVAMEEVLKAARWANQSTFTTFYLRDVAEDLEGIKRLGPINVAQSVLR
jgi:integrase